MQISKSMVSLLWLGVFVVLLSLLLFSSGVSVANAEASVVEQSSQDSVTEAAEDVNNEVKNWVGVIMGALSTIFSAGIFAFLNKHKKQTVSVSVNDETTQNKLDKQAVLNSELQNSIRQVIILQKGMIEAFTELYAENPNFDKQIQTKMKQIKEDVDTVVINTKKIIESEEAQQIKDVIKQTLLG